MILYVWCREEEARRHNGALEVDGYTGISDDAAKGTSSAQVHKAAVNIENCEEQGHFDEQSDHGHRHGGSQVALKDGGGGGQEVLQVPVNNGGRTNQYVWSQVFVFVCVSVCVFADVLWFCECECMCMNLSFV